MFSCGIKDRKTSLCQGGVLTYMHPVYITCRHICVLDIWAYQGPWADSIMGVKGISVSCWKHQRLHLSFTMMMMMKVTSTIINDAAHGDGDNGSVSDDGNDDDDDDEGTDNNRAMLVVAGGMGWLPLHLGSGRNLTPKVGLNFSLVTLSLSIWVNINPPCNFIMKRLLWFYCLIPFGFQHK